MARLSIRFSNETVPADIVQASINCLRKHTAKAIGSWKEDEPFSVVASVEDKIVGGLIGRVVRNWLYLDAVWVEQEFRRSGIGSEVMKTAEERAREMKLTGIYLWTQTWQTPGFYTKLGYTQFVEFRDFPPGHSRVGFCKYLR